MRAALVTAILLLTVATASAQTPNRSLRLNPSPLQQYLSVVNKSDLENPTGYTIEAWVYPTSTANYPTIVGDTFESGYWLGIDASTGKLRWWPIGSDQDGVMLSTTVVPLNKWTHIAVTYDAPTGTAKMYFDGVLDATDATYVGNVSPAAGDLRIGADRSSFVGGATTFYWLGWLDEVRIWKGARTQLQIQSLRFVRAGNAHFLPGSAYENLVGYWDFDDPAVGVQPDRRGTPIASDATPINGAATTAAKSAPIAYNTGLFLGGAADYAEFNLPEGFSFENGVTIEAWIAPYIGALSPEGVGYPAYPTIVGRHYPTSFWLGLSPTGHLRFWPNGGDGAFESFAFIAPNTWTHVAATYRPGITALYVNGQLDSYTTAFTDPIGENGIVPRIGADSTDGFSNYPWLGVLDEVRLTDGVLGASRIRADMFRSSPALELVPDELGAPRTRLTACLEPRGTESVHGALARFERSGAPLFGAGTELWNAAIEGYHVLLDGETPSGPLPGGTGPSLINSDLPVTQDVTVNDVNVFVSLAAHSDYEPLSWNALEGVNVILHAPDATQVELMGFGDGNGRDLQTVFDDGATFTLLTGRPPYVEGVQPSSSLIGLNGSSTLGTWRLEVTTSKGYEVGLWAWGLSFNNILPLAAGEARAPTLELAGSNPVRDEGALVFRLPAADDVRVDLLDAAGRRVRPLVRARFEAGEHQLAWRAQDLPSGIYFARLELGRGGSRQAKVAVVH